jgi:hypothetical protein
LQSRRGTLQLIYFPKLDPTSDLFKKLLIIVNKESYLNLQKQLAAASIPFDEMSLLGIISYLTDLTEKQPALLKNISPQLKHWLSTKMGTNSPDEASKAFEIITKGFDSLYDLPLTIPEIKTLNLGGTFIIVTSDNSQISKKDLLFYDLSAEYSASGNGDAQILHYDFKDKLTIQGNSVAFSFSDDEPWKVEDRGEKPAIALKGR